MGGRTGNWRDLSGGGEAHAYCDGEKNVLEFRKGGNPFFGQPDTREKKKGGGNIDSQEKEGVPPWLIQEPLVVSKLEPALKRGEKEENNLRFFPPRTGSFYPCKKKKEIVNGVAVLRTERVKLIIIVQPSGIPGKKGKKQIFDPGLFRGKKGPSGDLRRRTWDAN